MKKRRELDALVSGKQSSNGGVRLTPKNGKHELLRNESESSDVEEFSLPSENAARKRGRSSVCTSCITVLCVFLLVSCIVAVSGLFFLHFKLKSEVDQLRHEISGDRIQQLSDQIGELRTAQQQINNAVEELKKGERGVERIIYNVSVLIKQVSALNATTKTLSESIASSSQILSLPQQFTDLSKNIASIGSNVETVQGEVKSLVESKTTAEQKIKDLDAKILTIQLETVSKVGSTSETKPESGTADINELKKLATSLSSLNETLELYITDAKSHTAQHDAAITELRNYTSLFNTRLTFLELKSGEMNARDQNNNISQIVSSIIREQMERFHNSTNQEQLTMIRNQLSSLQAQCGNDSEHTVELMNEISNMARITSHLIKSTDSKFQNVNSTIERLWSAIEAGGRKVGHSGGQYDSSDKLSAGLINELEVTSGQAEGQAGQQTTSTTVQSLTSSVASRTETPATKGNDANGLNADEKARLKRLLNPD